MSRFRKQEDNKMPEAIMHERADLELIIDSERLNEELMNQPLMYRKWAKLKSEVNKKAKIIKLKLEQVEGQKYLTFTKDGGKVKELESRLDGDLELIQLKQELYEAEAMAEEYDGICKAFYMRHEAIKELCANLRKEIV